ncbi:hypothetical protein BASA81_005926 [Batrachochytrium salamandrivorans]|nr:hypothetical protein BASA81_005926 [Batrachochytrium salamandrivorans]
MLALLVLVGVVVFFVATGHTTNPVPQSTRSQAAVYAELEAQGRASRIANWALNVTAHQTLELSLTEGTLEFVFDRIGSTSKQHVDLTEGKKSTEAKGWSRIEIKDSSLLSQDTVVSQLKANGVVKSVDYVSMDGVGADCFVLREIACELQPRYEIVDVVPKLSVMLIRKDLLQGTKVHETEHWRKATELPMYSAFGSGQASHYMCVYEIYQETKDFVQCSGQAVNDQLAKLGFSFWNKWYYW